MQLPKRYTAPLSEDFTHAADPIIELFNRAWITPEKDQVELYLWQQWLLKRVLETYPPDHPKFPNQYRYRQVVCSLPRQVGKSVIASLLAFNWMLRHPGTMTIGIASSVDQAQIVYRRVSLVINSHPALKKRFSKTTTTRGIASSDGRTTYQIKASKSSALMGLAISGYACFDEVHCCPPELWSDLVNGTASQENAMVFGITTAGSTSDSHLLADLYKTGDAAIAGEPSLERFGFFEWSAPDGAAVDDPEALKQANPTLAEGHINIDNVLSDIAAMPEQDARRYRLNLFITGGEAQWISPSMFNKVVTQTPLPEGRYVYSIDRTHSWEYATITASCKKENKIHSQIIATLIKPTKDQLLRICLELAKTNPLGFVAEGYMLKELMQDLQKHGLKAYSLNAMEVCSASSTAYALIAQERVALFGDPLLFTQSPHATRKDKGDHWRIARNRESGQDIDAVMATVMGVYLASRELEEDIQLF